MSFIKYPILWLPLLSLALFMLAVGLELELQNHIMWAAILLFWTGSFICEHVVISWNRDSFSVWYWLSFLFIVLALLTMLCCFVNPIVFTSLTILLWPVLFCLSLCSLMEEVIRKRYDFSTWVLFGTQILLAFGSIIVWDNIPMQ